jgi:hypothetical protein
MTGVSAALCEVLHTVKRIFLRRQISNSSRPPLAASYELLERAPVKDGQAAAPHYDDACLSPDRKLLTHDFARDPQHSGQFHLRDIESRGWLGFLAWLVSLDQRDYLFGQTRVLRDFSLPIRYLAWRNIGYWPATKRCALT